MRADRLVATLLLLQARGRVTAAEVAEELEISVATARRDLEALSLAGIPVYPRPGRGGGWSLVGGARTDLSGLTAAEARALFTLVGPSAAVVPEARAALRKLVQALPETFRADARAAADAVVIDSARWGDQHRSRPPLVDALQAAVVRRRRVRLLYDRHRHRMGGGAPTAGAGPTAWLVDPHGLVDKDDVWYLVAGTDRGRRTFRVDRIVEAEVTDEPADRPDDFDLGTAWRGVVDEVEERRSLTAATVVVAASLVPVLRGQFGRHCTVEGAEAGGRARVRVAAPTPLMIAQHLAGWGAGLDVVGPESVQAELARIGAELISRYAR